MKDGFSNSRSVMYWDSVHSGPEDSLSWNEKNVCSTLDLVLSCSPKKDDIILDVGCGQSGIVLSLSKMGYNNIFALDISRNALSHLVSNLSRIKRIESVKIIDKDILESDDVIPDGCVKVWHDRFTFHFLVDSNHVRRYLNLSEKKIAPGGYMVLTTYSDPAPDRCS